MQSKAHSGAITAVLENIHFSRGTVWQVKQHELCLKRAVHFVEVGGSIPESESGMLPIAITHQFCELMSVTTQEHIEAAVIVCPEQRDLASRQCACFLLGAYLILRQGRNLTEVSALFKDFEEENNTLTTRCMVNGWSAMYRAREICWLGPVADQDEDRPFDLEMSLHYAEMANGTIYTLVPGKLILFPTPARLSSGQSWADVSESGGATARRFSAPYLAELLADLDVSVVACLGQTSSASADAFLERGLDVHDLLLDPRRPSLLRAMDRVLSLARAAPGAVAVFCGGVGGTDWPAHVGMLAAAYLVSDFGFDAGAADAWLCMLCPALRLPAHAAGAGDAAGVTAPVE